jgi:hypothetical protein
LVLLRSFAAHLPKFISRRLLVEQHVKIIAILNIVFGVIGVIAALFVLVFFGGLAAVAGSDHDPDAPVGAAILGSVGVVAALAVGVMAVPSILTGWGLLKYRRWAQILGIILSVLSLPGIPLGTALGIYGLWVLLNKETKPLFNAA